MVTLEAIKNKSFQFNNLGRTEDKWKQVMY